MAAISGSSASVASATRTRPSVGSGGDSYDNALAETMFGLYKAELIRRGQEMGTVRADMPAELLQALLVGADEAADRWLFSHWETTDEAEMERICSEMFAIFRRMLEKPPK